MEILVDSVYFNLIKSGRKTVEGRCARQKYKDLQIDEEIIFRPSDSKDSSSFMKAVTRKVTWYKSFDEMLLTEGLANCLPDISTIEEGCKIYRAFPNYAQDEAELGVIAIQFRLL